MRVATLTLLVFAAAATILGVRAQQAGFTRTVVQQRDLSVPEGWYADVAVNLSPKFAIVGEAGWHLPQR